MKIFNCFDIVKIIIEEASNQFSPLFREDPFKLSRLKSQCDYIDKIANQYNGISCEVEIDSITTEISIILALDDKSLVLSSIILPQLAQSEIFFDEEHSICLKFIVPGIWSKNKLRKELTTCLN